MTTRFRLHLPLLIVTGILLFVLPRVTFAAGPNLIPNAGFEVVSSTSSTSPAQWTKGRWGTNTTVFSYPAASVDGSRAAKVTISSYTSGDAKWAFSPIAVTSGRTYSYTDSYSSSVPTFVTIQYTKTDGTFLYVDAATSPSTSSGWGSASISFTVPQGVTAVTIFHLINRVGELTLDNVSLTDVTPPPSSNLISNSSFETPGIQGRPADFTIGRYGTNTTSFIYPAVGHTGAKAAAIQISTYTSGDAKWYFPNVAVSPGEAYEFSDYSHATVPTKVTVQFKKSDGTFMYQELGTVPASDPWVFSKYAFSIPQGVVSLTVFHVIQGVGTLTVDDYSLLKLQSDPTKFDQGYVSLNFDDGWLSVYQNAIPILNTAGFKSDQFIITGRLSDQFPGYVKPAQVLDMQSKGHIIGAHTRTHPDLTMLSPSDAQAEISGSRQDLLQIGVTPVQFFAYPLGAYNAQIQQLVRDAGFLAGRSSNGGQNDKVTDRYALRRFGMINTTTFAQVKNEIDAARQNRTWLIILFHEVNDTNDTYAVTPQLFQQIVDYLKQQQITPITLSQGMQLMNQ